MGAGKVYLVKIEAPGPVLTPSQGVNTSCSPVLLLRHPTKSRLISHHASPAHPPPVVSSPTLHFGISQQGHHLGIMVPSLHGTAVLPPACSGVHLGLAPLQCNGWRHRDPLQQAVRARGSQRPQGAPGTRNGRDTPATPPSHGRGYDGRNLPLLL